MLIFDRARIVVGALSGWNEHGRRDVCRKTWVTELQELDVPTMFLLGSPKAISEPYCNDGDELILPCPDNYPSLPQKTRWFCRYALECFDFDYLFKCDDDTYVHAQRFIQYDQAGKDYIGIDPTGENKFNSGGAGYFLSKRAARIVADELTDATGPEDLLVGKLMARHGIPRTNDHRFQAWKLDRTIPTKQNDGITVHYIRGEEMLKIHEALKSP